MNPIVLRIKKLHHVLNRVVTKTIKMEEDSFIVIVQFVE